MTPQQMYETALKLAPQGLCMCRVCQRVGPLNGALVTWWAGLPLNVLCPECFGIGRQVLLTRRFEGIEAKVLEQGGGGKILMPNAEMSADLAQTKLSRSPSEGW